MARIKPLSDGPIAKPGARKQSVHRVISEKHLAFVRTLPCAVTGMPGGNHAHHLTIDRYRMGRKAGDDRTVPLRPEMHQDRAGALHVVGEKKFWNSFGIDPEYLAAVLWENTGDFIRCEAEVMAARAAGRARLMKSVKIYDLKQGL